MSSLERYRVFGFAMFDNDIVREFPDDIESLLLELADDIESLRELASDDIEGSSKLFLSKKLNKKKLVKIVKIMISIYIYIKKTVFLYFSLSISVSFCFFKKLISSSKFIVTYKMCVKKV